MASLFFNKKFFEKNILLISQPGLSKNNNLELLEAIREETNISCNFISCNL